MIILFSSEYKSKYFIVIIQPRNTFSFIFTEYISASIFFFKLKYLAPSRDQRIYSKASIKIIPSETTLNKWSYALPKEIAYLTKNKCTQLNCRNSSLIWGYLYCQHKLKTRIRWALKETEKITRFFRYSYTEYREFV